MSFSHVPAELRRFVTARAEHLCEYCLLAEEDLWFGCQIDHVISEKHGGLTVAENLALACVNCNRSKGSDIGSLHPASGQFLRFYNPRIDRWAKHFRLVDAHIEATTPRGEVRAKILNFNVWDRILERQSLRGIARYPNRRALHLINA